MARRRADDPNATYPQLIAGAEAEVRRLEEALARLEPVVANVALGARGSDDAQRALFGVREDQSWVDWRNDKLGR